jgi:hypothetical protein
MSVLGKVYGERHSDSTGLWGPNVGSFGGVSMARRFNTGHTSVEDDENTGRPTSCTPPGTVARIQNLVRQDRRRTIHDIAWGGGWLWDC